jgi:alpha,alpha-trehalase
MPLPEKFFIESLASLYTAVQSQEIFPDSKFFVDCVPVIDPALLINAFEQEKNQPGFNLKKFVEKYFVFPAEIMNHYTSANKSIHQHLQDLWEVLTRVPGNEAGTLIPLPFPYIVPGGRFREVYYWDSYFTALGLQVSKRVDIIQNMVDNFAYLIDTIGFIPNANRTYYLGRSQPPFFVMLIELLSEEKGTAILLQYQTQLEKEYAFWMEGEKNVSATNRHHRRVVQLPDGSTLNRYWDDNDTPRPESYIEDVHLAKKTDRKEETVFRHIRAAAESGWDFSSRWFKDGQTMETVQTTDLVPVDLNCLLLHTEEVLLEIYSLKKDSNSVRSFEDKIQRRKAAIQKYCWNENKGFYFDFNPIENKQSNLYSLAAVYPLFFLIADEVQAKQTAQVIEEKFLQPGGVVTTPYKTGQQWDAPNGWAPLQWITYKGLKNYGHLLLANLIKQRWMATNEKVYAQTGKMMEKYNVMDTGTKAGGGEYPNQDGFGWTNGVYCKLLSEL